MSSTAVHTLKRFGALLRAQVAVAVLLLVWGIWRFRSLTEGHGVEVEEIVRRSHLDTVVAIHGRLLLVHLIVAVVATVVAWPILHRSAVLGQMADGVGRLRGIRLLALTLGVDALLLVLAVGPLFDHVPGIEADVVRGLTPLLGDIDLRFVRRWHLPIVASLGVAALLGWELLFYARTLPRWLRLAPAVAVWGLLLSLAWPAALAGGGATGAAAGAADAAPLNVLVIASDSLRFDRLGVHGYHRPDITPNIDAFAREAVDFRNMHVSTASTLESWATVLTGQFPPTHGLRYMYVTHAQAEAATKRPEILPRLLRREGYLTAVVSDWAGNCFKLIDFGFERTLVGDVQNIDALIAEAAIDANPLFPLFFNNALGERLVPDVRRTTRYVRPGSLSHWAMAEAADAASSGRPFFEVLFSSTTHIPYRSSPEFNSRYVDPAYDGPHRYHLEIRAHELITTGFEPTMPPEVIQHIRDLYDGAVAEFDHQVGQVLAEIKRRGLWDRTIVIVTSDHGEDLYDPGSTLGHGTNFFGGDQSTRIPFLIRVPGVTRPGTSVDAIVRNADIAPTLLSVLGIDVPASYEGVDLTPLLNGEATDLDLPAFAETCYLFFPKTAVMPHFSDQERAQVLAVAGARDTLEVDPEWDGNLVLKQRFHEPVLATKDRMVRTRRWKLIEIPGKDRPIRRLYDMAADPGQTKDLAADGLRVTPALIELLEEYWAGRGRGLRWPLAAEESPPAGGATVVEAPPRPADAG